MELYLLRHAQAVSEWQDPTQPLSVSGRQDIERLALWQKENGFIQTEMLFHSGKLRAQQTAEILQTVGMPEVTVSQKSGLMPNDPVEDLRSFLEVEWTHLHPNQPNLLIVGHLPYLDRLVNLLLCGHSAHTLVDIQPCTLVCLTGNFGRWAIKWVIPPILLR